MINMDEKEKIQEKWRNEILEMRSIHKEYQRLIDEYNDEPSPHSPAISSIKGMVIPQTERMNSYTIKRQCLKIKIDLCNQILQEFMTYITVLPYLQRHILEAFIITETYAEMCEYVTSRGITSATDCKRKLPLIYLTLEDILDINELPTMQSLNEAYFQKIKELKLLTKQ